MCNNESWHCKLMSTSLQCRRTTTVVMKQGCSQILLQHRHDDSHDFLANGSMNGSMVIDSSCRKKHPPCAAAEYADWSDYPECFSHVSASNSFTTLTTLIFGGERNVALMTSNAAQANFQGVERKWVIAPWVNPVPTQTISMLRPQSSTSLYNPYLGSDATTY